MPTPIVKRQTKRGPRAAASAASPGTMRRDRSSSWRSGRAGSAPWAGPDARSRPARCAKRGPTPAPQLRRQSWSRGKSWAQHRDRRRKRKQRVLLPLCRGKPRHERGGRTERHGFRRPSVTARQAASAAKPMAFLVALKIRARIRPPTDAHNISAAITVWISRESERRYYGATPSPLVRAKGSAAGGGAFPGQPLARRLQHAR